jgi:hypothetical protein
LSRAEGPTDEVGREEVPAVRRGGFTRRRLLTGGAAASLAAVLAGRPDGPAQLLMSLARDVGGIPIPKAEPKTFSFQVEREADLVLLDITFYGFYLNSGGGEVTSLVPGGSDNVVVVQFPPQAIGEASYYYTDTKEPWWVDPPPVLSALAGPSRLCFTLNSGQQVDFPTMTPADLLDWSSWTLLVPEVAQVDESELDRIDARSSARRSNVTPASAPPRVKPSEMVTSIEYPYALFLAPAVYTGGPLFGFTTTFSGRKEPLVGESGPGGSFYEEPQVTGVSDCWTAALEVSYYDRQEYEREFEVGISALDLTREDRPDLELGLGNQFHGVQVSPPPQPARKPEVAAIWTRDYESVSQGATPATVINYDLAAPKIIRRAAKALAGRNSRAGTSLDQSTRVTPASKTRVAPASRTRRARKVVHHLKKQKHEHPRRKRHQRHSDRRG